MQFYPRVVLDFGPRELVRLLLPADDEVGDLALIDASLATGRPFATALSVRSAFDILLSCIGEGGGGEIAFSAVTVPGMAAIAHHHGYRVRTADIDASNLTVSLGTLAKVTGPQTRMAVIAPLFGSRYDLSSIASYCRERNILIVEDAAQCWDGSYTGSPHADVVLFSFGPVKTGTALAGAVAIFKDEQLARQFAAVERQLPRLPTSWRLRRLLKFGFIGCVMTPVMFGLAMRALALAGRDPDKFVGSAAKGFVGGDLMERIRHRLPAQVRHLIALRLSGHPGTRPREERARAMLIRLAPGIMVPGRHAASNAYWLLGVCVDRPERLVARLRAAGFDASQGASSLVAITDDETGNPPPDADRMMKMLVYLPVTRFTGAEEMSRMAAIVNSHAAHELPENI